LQTFSKLLWQIRRKGREGHKDLPLINADTTDQKELPNPKALPLINTDDTDRKKLPNPGHLPRINADDADRKKQNEEKNLVVRFSAEHPSTLARVGGGARILPFEATRFEDRSWAHAPSESKAA
jgi:hypothetical protein